jgi:hypothetical protein
MIFRAVILAAIAIIMCGIVYVIYSKKNKPQEVWLYFDEEGFAYDKTCLEQKVFIRIMRNKLNKPCKIERKI